MQARDIRCHLRGRAVTPDEVVARARELEGREVLLTVRGSVRVSNNGWIMAGDPSTGWHHIHAGSPVGDLVDIQPAMRIEAGALYRDAAGGLIFEGDDQGMLLRPGRSDTYSPATYSPASFPGLQRVKGGADMTDPREVLDEIAQRIDLRMVSILDVKAMSAALRAVLDLHRPWIVSDEQGDFCAACSTDMPCRTVRKITEALGGAT